MEAISKGSSSGRCHKLGPSVSEREREDKSTVEKCTDRLNELKYFQNKVKNLEDRCRVLEDENRGLEEANKTLKGNIQVISLQNNKQRKRAREHVHKREEEMKIDNFRYKEEHSALRKQLNEKIRSEWSLHMQIKEMEESIQQLHFQISEAAISCKQKDHQIVQLHIENNAVEEKNDSLVQENGQLIASLLDAQEESKRQAEERPNDANIIKTLQTEIAQLCHSTESLAKEKGQLKKKVVELSAYAQSVEVVFEKFRIQCGARESNALQLFGFISDFISNRFSTLERFCDKMEELNCSLHEEKAKEPKHDSNLECDVDDLEMVTVQTPRHENSKRPKLALESSEPENIKMGVEKSQEENLKKTKIDADMCLRNENNKLLERNKSIVKDKLELEASSRSLLDRTLELEQQTVGLKEEKESLEAELRDLKLYNNLLINENKKLEGEILNIDKVFKKLQNMCEPGEIIANSALDLFTFIADFISSRFPTMDKFCDTVEQLESRPEANLELERQVDTLHGETQQLQKKMNLLSAEKIDLELKITGFTKEKDVLDRKVVELTGEKIKLKQHVNELTAEKLQIKDTLDALTKEKLQLEAKVDIFTSEKQHFEEVCSSFRAKCGSPNLHNIGALELFTLITNLISARFPSLEDFQVKLTSQTCTDSRGCNPVDEMKTPDVHEILNGPCLMSESLATSMNSCSNAQLRKRSFLDTSHPGQSSGIPKLAKQNETDTNNDKTVSVEDRMATIRPLGSQVVKISYADSDNDEEIDVDD